MMIKKIIKLLEYISILGLLKGIQFLVGKKLKINKKLRITSVKSPIHLRPYTSDDEVFRQIFVSNEYDINLDFSPKVIVDGGANIGLATIYFKNKYPDAKIIAIEPDPGNCEILKINSSYYNDIFIKQAGLWSKNVQTQLSDKYNLGKWGLVLEEVNDQVGTKDNLLVNIISLNDIMNEFALERIDLLKLDIESAEKELFAENYMNWLPKTKVIVIELHDWLTSGCSKPFFLAINQAFNDYSFKQIGENTVIINNDL